MMNQKIMNQKNTMNILALKLIRDFFDNPFTKPYAIYWEDVPQPNNSEIELFKSFGIPASEDLTDSLLKLWGQVEAINHCVNDTATCDNCEKELDEHWKCCSHCPNAICKECYECKQCDEYYNQNSEDDYQRCGCCGAECGAYMCAPCKQFED